jgi:AmmeMemoRadiSam system protein B
VTTERRVRAPAVAGLFYPSEPVALRQAVKEALEGARSKGVPAPAPKAFIAPHAAYDYSGPVAATAYARVLPARGTIERVVLIGPAHRFPLSGVAISSADAFATPLGEVAVDVEGREALSKLAPVVVSDEVHADEHSLEVHLPFIQVALGDVAVVPLAVGQMPAADVADVFDAVWGGPETLVVLSSDLSHYHDHTTAVALDRATATAIEMCRPGDVGVDRACGVYGLRGLLVAALRRRMEVTTIDLRTSADTAGSPDSVVGYGSFVLV